MMVAGLPFDEEIARMLGAAEVAGVDAQSVDVSVEEVWSIYDADERLLAHGQINPLTGQAQITRCQGSMRGQI